MTKITNTGKGMGDTATTEEPKPKWFAPMIRIMTVDFTAGGPAGVKTGENNPTPNNNPQYTPPM